ncbi:MFS transporter [Stygiolobus caldivivus]|uniref:MFS transporter n=1 Tax=Stygiolobus caldivivus TaxID=2824673 RepID=A0A8D5U8W3_9CREN|nr:MFS transporter [Stygiolobus caldivivus]BCU70869.1 MFS transporter [Stygiolobus caldivivus]
MPLRNKEEVLKISFSAFFADLGYQAAVGSLPILLVVFFHAPVFIYGITEALNYGGGSLISLLGGYMADRVGSKIVAVTGNALIIILSFTGLAQNYLEAVILFVAGWWSRNFRTPARRAMLAEVTSDEERKEAYGILHALDIGGAMLAVTYLTLALYFNIWIGYILLFTLIPLTVSTMLLYLVKAGKKGIPKRPGKTALFLVVSTMFFGFSQYSFGFPILTAYGVSHKTYLATITYGVFLGFSSLFGYVFGKAKLQSYKGLAFLGYLLASIATLGFAILSSHGLLFIYLLSALMGIAVASTETFEPTIMSKLSPQGTGSSMGALSFGRSIGLLVGNSLMGFLYQISYSYAYIFAAIMSFIAFIIVIIKVRES